MDVASTVTPYVYNKLAQLTKSQHKITINLVGTWENNYLVVKNKLEIKKMLLNGCRKDLMAHWSVM